MRQLSLVSLVSLVLAACLATAEPAHPATFKRCGDVMRDGVFIGKIRSKRLACREARFVVRAFYDLSKPRDFERELSNGKLKRVRYVYKGRHRSLRYEYKDVGFEAASVRLYNGGRSIRWLTTS
jgi:hypothetical protein